MRATLVFNDGRVEIKHIDKAHARLDTVGTAMFAEVWCGSGFDFPLHPVTYRVHNFSLALAGTTRAIYLENRLPSA